MALVVLMAQAPLRAKAALAVLAVMPMAPSLVVMAALVALVALGATRVSIPAEPVALVV